METAREMIRESLPIKCLEAVILGMYPFTGACLWHACNRFLLIASLVIPHKGWNPCRQGYSGGSHSYMSYIHMFVTLHFFLAVAGDICYWHTCGHFCCSVVLRTVLYVCVQCLPCYGHPWSKVMFTESIYSLCSLTFPNVYVVKLQG